MKNKFKIRVIKPEDIRLFGGIYEASMIKKRKVSAKRAHKSK